MKAIIVVDMQNDFISGSLPVARADEIIVPIQTYLREVLSSKQSAFICFTGCAHPKDHSSFKEQGGKWPTHCIRGTLGADLQFGLQCIQRAYALPLFLKGRNREKEEYSGFENEFLCRSLEIAKVREIEVFGLARDYCVSATAEAAQARGYQVTVLEDLCRAVVV